MMCFLGSSCLNSNFYFDVSVVKTSGAVLQKLSTTDEMDDIVEGDIEPLFSSGDEAAIRIEGLRKVYNDGKVAVTGLCLDFFENNVTALLGHNGAGKSTTISMLTGMIQPTSGDAKILGYSILSNMNDVRRCIFFTIIFIL